MKRLSVKEALLNVIEDTDDSIDLNIAMRWATRTEKKINSKRGYILRSALRTVANCKVSLPEDCVEVLMVLEGDYMDEQGKFSDLYMDSLINDYTDELGIEHYWINLDATTVSPALWEEFGNELMLSSEYDDLEVTIQYKALETDTEGYLVVNESHIDAIEAYLRYKIADKYRHILFKKEKILRDGHTYYVEERKNEYHRAIRQARAEDTKLSRKEIYDLWNGRY